MQGPRGTGQLTWQHPHAALPVTAIGRDEAPSVDASGFGRRQETCKAGIVFSFHPLQGDGKEAERGMERLAQRLHHTRCGRTCSRLCVEEP